MSAKTGHDIRPHRHDAPLQGTGQWQAGAGCTDETRVESAWNNALDTNM